MDGGKSLPLIPNRNFFCHVIEAMSARTAFLRLNRIPPETSPKKKRESADIFQRMWSPRATRYQVVRLALRCVSNDLLLPNFAGNVVFYVPRASFPEPNVSSNERNE